MLMSTVLCYYGYTLELHPVFNQQVCASAYGRELNHGIHLALLSIQTLQLKRRWESNSARIPQPLIHLKQHSLLSNKWCSPFSTALFWHKKRWAIYYSYQSV